MGLLDLLEAIIRNPIESLATVILVTILAMIYTTLRPEVAGGPFIQEFDAIFNAAILSIELIAVAGTIGLCLLAWETFANDRR